MRSRKSRSAAPLILPNQFQRYLEATGWELDSTVNNERLHIFHSPPDSNGNRVEVVVPKGEHYADYEKRANDALVLMQAVTGKSIETLMKLIQGIQLIDEGEIVAPSRPKDAYSREARQFRVDEGVEEGAVPAIVFAVVLLSGCFFIFKAGVQLVLLFAQQLPAWASGITAILFIVLLAAAVPTFFLFCINPRNLPIRNRMPARIWVWAKKVYSTFTNND